MVQRNSNTKTRPARTPLTRHRVLGAALAFVDAHGLDALTMRKLGAELNVEGAALYNHVDDKDALLDGIVELIWSEAVAATDASGEWQTALRSLAHALRAVTHRHPRAAPLVFSRDVMPRAALELFGACLARLEQAGFDRAAGARALHAVTGYAYGYASMELAGRGPRGGAAETEAQRIRRVTQMLPSDIPDELFDVGLAICGCDTAAQFESGVELIVAGLRPAPRATGSSRA